MTEGPKVDLIVPYPFGEGERSKSGTHAELRQTYGGKIINLGPTQPYKNPVTQEVANQPYKYSNPTGTPWDMNLNYIPGMQPFQWDLASLVVTFAAPFIGVAEGLTDKSSAKALIKEVNERHPTPTVEEILQVAERLNKPLPTGGGGGAAGGLGGAPSEFFKRFLSVDGKGVRYVAGGPNGILTYNQKINESNGLQQFLEEMRVRNAKWFKVEALGKDGKLKLDYIHQLMG
jgi:hypothetical protein